MQPAERVEYILPAHFVRSRSYRPHCVRGVTSRRRAQRVAHIVAELPHAVAKRLMALDPETTVSGAVTARAAAAPERGRGAGRRPCPRGRRGLSRPPRSADPRPGARRSGGRPRGSTANCRVPEIVIRLQLVRSNTLMPSLANIARDKARRRGRSRRHARTSAPDMPRHRERPVVLRDEEREIRRRRLDVRDLGLEDIDIDIGRREHHGGDLFRQAAIANAHLPQASRSRPNYPSNGRGSRCRRPADRLRAFCSTSSRASRE